MRRLGTTFNVVLTMIALAPSLVAGSKPVPTRLAQAQYVALGYDLGDRFVSESDSIGNTDVLPEDRAALARLRDQITKWNRYVVTPRPADAELVIAMRRGRRTANTLNVPLGGPGQAPGTTTTSLRGEVSSRDDMLSVYESVGGTSGSFGRLLWREQRALGLSSASPSLFEELQSAVESLTK